MDLKRPIDETDSSSEHADDEIEFSIDKLEAFAFNKLRKPFEKHLQHLDDIYGLLGGLIAKSQMKTASVPPSKHLAANLCIRILNELESVNLLCSYGYVLQAFSIASVIYELSWTVAAIGNDDQRASDWFYHDNEDRSFDRIKKLVQQAGNRLMESTMAQSTLDNLYFYYKFLCLGKHANPKLQAAMHFIRIKKTNDRIYEYGPDCSARGIQLGWQLIKIVARSTRPAIATYATYHFLDGQIGDGMSIVDDLVLEENKLDRRENGALAHFALDEKQAETIGRRSYGWTSAVLNEKKKSYQSMDPGAVSILEDALKAHINLAEQAHYLFQAIIRLSKCTEESMQLAHEESINLIMRVCNELRAVVLLCRNGYWVQAYAATSVIFEVAWTIAAIGSNHDLAHKWLTHESDRAFLGMREAIRMGLQNINGSAPNDDLVNDAYAPYKELCLYKHINPMVQRNLGFDSDPESGAINFRNGPDASTRSIEHSRWLIITSIRSFYPGLETFINTYVEADLRERKFADINSLEARLAELEQLSS